MLGSFSGSLSSSRTFSSLDSPLRERASTWSFVEVPPAIAENQAPSTSGESGFHDMSRQASKTESSESTAECGGLNDHVLEEMIKQSAEYGESETSRSSSDTTITPEEQLVDDADHHKACASSETSSNSNITSKGNPVSDNQAMQTHDIDSTESSVFDEPSNKKGDQRVFNCGNSLLDLSAKIVNYDADFPEILGSSSNPGKCDSVSDKSDILHCDQSVTNQTLDSSKSSSDSKDVQKPDVVSLNRHQLVSGHSSSGLTKCASESVRDTNAEIIDKSERGVVVIKTDIHIREPDSFSKGKGEISECIDEAVVEDIDDAQCDEITHL